VVLDHESCLVISSLLPLIYHATFDRRDFPIDVSLEFLPYVLLEHACELSVVVISHDQMPVGLTNGVARALSVCPNDEL